MSSTKKLQRAAQKFRRENPELYARYAVKLHTVAKSMKKYECTDK